MRLSKRFMVFLSVLILCGAVGVLTPPAEQAGATKIFDKFKKGKKQGKCDVHPTWSEVIPGDERFVPTTFVDGAGESAAYCDRQTGLVWETEPSSDPFVWGDEEGFPNAKGHCINRSVGTNGQLGWRLASIAELASLVDTTSTSCTGDNKCIPDGSPFEILTAAYWSASEVAGLPASAWVVQFSGGGRVQTFIKSRINRAWCVRGATDADVY